MLVVLMGGVVVEEQVGIGASTTDILGIVGNVPSEGVLRFMASVAIAVVCYK